MGEWEKVGSRQLGGSEAKLECVEGKFLRIGAETRGGRRATHGLWGHCFKCEVEPEMDVGRRGSSRHKSLPVRQEGFWCRMGREIKRRSQLP